MAQEWVQLHCPKCGRLHEFPVETVAYICGKCLNEVRLDMPEPEEDDDSGDGNWYFEGE